MRETTKVGALVGVLAVLVLLAFAGGCGLVSDQSQQEAQKNVEAGQEDLKRKVDDLHKKMDDVQAKLDEVAAQEQPTLDELQKKVEGQEQPDPNQKEKK